MRRLDSHTTVSIVIPCYNEEDVLPLLFERLTAAVESWGANYEVILVDDGSSDATWDLLEAQHQKSPRWKAIRLARNFGHQIALWTGLSHVTGDVVAVLDADLQDPPEVVRQFLDKWVEGYDVVYAVRQQRKENVFKRAAYFCFYRILAFLSDIEIPLDSGDFCVVDRHVVRVITQSTEQQPFIRGLRAWAGFRQIGVAYVRHERAAGEVKYTFRKLVQLAANGVFSFSTRPLRLATFMGFVISAIAFGFTCFVIVQRIFIEQFARWGFPYVPGFATIASIALFLGGVQLLCLGILGEYIGRIYENVKGRPQYIVREFCGFADAPAQSER
jgi:dolichol-phosphate mannosyltransferase